MAEVKNPILVEEKYGDVVLLILGLMDFQPMWLTSGKELCQRRRAQERKVKSPLGYVEGSTSSLVAK